MSRAPEEPIVVVYVEESIAPALAGHDGSTYASPPMACAEALSLVRLLTGRDEVTDVEGCWRCAIAGGQRTVTLVPTPSDPRDPRG